MLSFTLRENSHFQSLTFLQKPNLFNVAITRFSKKKTLSSFKRPKRPLRVFEKIYGLHKRTAAGKKMSFHMVSKNVEENIYNNEFERSKEDAQVMALHQLLIRQGIK